MKILYILPHFFPAMIYGGPIVSSYKTIEELKTLNCELFVVTTNADKPTKQISNNSFKVENGYKIKRYNDTFLDKLSIPFLLNSWNDIRKMDIIHIQYIFSLTTPIALLYSKIFHKKVILSPRGSFAPYILTNGKPKTSYLKFLISPLIKNIFWHSTSEQESKEILDLYPNANIFIVPNGIDLKEYSNPVKLTKSEFCQEYLSQNLDPNLILISMGRMYKKKGFDILIESFAAYVIKNSGAILCIAGRKIDEYENLYNLVKKHCLEDKIFFVGEINGSKKINFFANADMFVLPSHNENFGNVYLEALAAGTPIIASKNTPWIIAQDRKCGLWIKNDIVSTTNAIETMANADLEILKVNSLYLASEFSWKAVAMKFYNKFESILQK